MTKITGGMTLKTIVLISLALGASVSAFAGNESSGGGGNPASMLCVKLGGVLERVETPAGARAHCAIEEWTLFRAMSEQGLVQHHQYGPGGMPNPASVNCADIGGELRIEEAPAGQDGVCVINDWALWHVFHRSALVNAEMKSE